MHLGVLRRLRDAVRRKRPEKWRTISWFLLLDNAPAHRPVLIKDVLAKKNVTTLEHPPYSSGPPPADFYLFSRLKSALKKRHCCDAPHIIKNATEELKRLSQNGFQDCFQNH
jgi:transposase